MARHARVDIRRRHPTLYREIMTGALAEIALAFNFWLSTPTFNPYGISKNVIGVVFFVLGASQVVLLNHFRNLPKLRIAQSVSVFFTFAWGLANTQQWVAGNASLQLPILFLTLCALQVPLVLEAPVNPMTEKS